MATSYKFPVLVWQDHQGSFTAKLVEYEHNFYLIYSGKFFGGNDRAPVGTGATADAAIYQIREYLQWSYEQYPWQPGPDFLDAKLLHFKVLLRPEYRVEDRIFPAEEPIALRVACVYGKQEDGLLVAALPMLGVRFYYYDAKTLKELVNHYVQERLKGMTPREISRFLPPAEVQLESLTLQVARREKKLVFDPISKTLSTVAEPLGERRLRRRFPRAWERDREVSDLINRIVSEKANVILVGESGVGKTTVLVDAVGQIERALVKQEEDDIANQKHKFWVTSGARMIAGMKYLGQWEERCEAVIEELSSINGVLCAEHLLDLVRTGGQSPVDSIATFFMPYLQRGELRLIAEATPAELAACRRLLPGFVDLFQILNIEPFNRTQALNVLGRTATSSKQNLHIEIADGAVELVYRLFKRFMPYQVFPGRSVKFLNELFERASIEKLEQITQARVIDHFISKTGLPELFLRDDLSLQPSEVIETLNQQVIGQLDACRLAANLIMTFKTGLNDPARPIGVLLFCGPTGVGKTELAKAMAKFFFGAAAEETGNKNTRLIRLDMSEYAGPGAAARLLGNPNGDPSDLINKVRQQPFIVLLLDEIEKADASVFDMLLSLFDEGRLTDQYGRVTIFRSAVIIMTSNLGADKFSSLGFNKAGAPSYHTEAMSFFRPEFYNRIDALVRFNALDQAMLFSITRKELSEIAAREGLAKLRLQLIWSERLLEFIAREGFDPRYGARPLQRTIEQLIVAPLAKFLLEHPDLKDSLIEVDLDLDGRVVFRI